MILLVLQPAIAQGIDSKFKAGLSINAEQPDALQRVLIVPTTNADTPTVKAALEQQNAFFEFKRTGNVYVSTISNRQIAALAANKSVAAIWPDLEVNATDETALSQINTQNAWKQGLLGDGVTIAILDSGIDASHPAFQNRIVNAHNFSGSSTVSDLLGHGTHVAAIAAGFGDANGVAPRAFLLNAKVLNDQGSGTFSSVIDGINWAIEQNADIINLSLGAASHETDSPLNRAVRDAMNAGVVVVVAAGNCGTICPSSSCNGFAGVTLPGNTLDALTVGAVNAQNQPACFSSHETISGTIKPDLTAPGVTIESAAIGGGTTVKSGTSMATPFAAGAAALAKQAHPGFSAFQIKSFLQTISTDLGEPGKDEWFGSGVLDLTRIAFADTNSLDDQNTPSNDSNTNTDVNALTGSFFFWGPEQLTRNQAGQFEIEHQPPGGLNQSNSAQDLPYKDTTVEFFIRDEFGTIIDYNSVGPFEITDLNNFHFPTFFNPLRVGTFLVQAFIYQDGQLLPNATNTANDIGSASAEKNVIVSLPDDLIQLNSLVIPSVLNKTEPLQILIPATNTGFLDTNAFLEIKFVNDQNNVSEVWASSIEPANAGQSLQFEINQANLVIPSGNYAVTATVFFENQKISQTQTTQVTVGTPFLLENAFPLEFIETKTIIPLGFSVQNNSNVDLQPVLRVEILDQNTATQSFFDDNTSINSGSQKTVSWNWNIHEPPGNYTIRFFAQTEETIQTIEQAIQIIDATAPIIQTTEFPSTIISNGFIPIHVRITDNDKIGLVFFQSNNQTIQAKKISGTDQNAEFSGAILANSTAGTQNFTVTACDASGLCNAGTANGVSIESLPSTCYPKPVLIVQDNDGVTPNDNGQNWLADAENWTACFQTWNTSEMGTPSLLVLQRFKPVIWSTGNHFANTLDQNETMVLQQFVDSGGRLLIEGSDVSSEHAFDSIAYDLLHAEFALEIGQDQSTDTNQAAPVWWNPSFSERYPIIIQTNASAIPAGSTLALENINSTGWNCQSNNQNIAIVNASQNTELDAVVLGTCGISANLKIFWKNQVDISANTVLNASDSNGYFIYVKTDANRLNAPRSECNVYEYCDHFEDGDYTAAPAWTVATGLWSASANKLATGSSNAQISMPVSMANANNFFFEADATLTSAPNSSVVISQVYGGGGLAGATYRNDFIELFNQTDAPVNLNGWSIQYSSATGSVWIKTDLNGSIPAHGYYLIKESSSGAVGVLLPTSNVNGTISLSTGTGKVALRNNLTLISGTCPIPADSSILDFVGYGTTANCFEGIGRTGSLTVATSAQRVPPNNPDTNNNSLDFFVGTPNPRNSSTFSESIAMTFAIGTQTSDSHASNNGYKITVSRTGLITLDKIVSGSPTAIISTTQTINSATTYNLKAQRSSGTWTLFLNGISIGTPAIDSTHNNFSFFSMRTNTPTGTYSIDNVHVIGNETQFSPAVTIGIIQTFDPNPTPINQISFYPITPLAFQLEPALVDYNRAPYADATLPTTNAFAIAGWDENHAGIIGWLNPANYAKTVFVSFSLDALTEENQFSLLNASISWLNQNPIPPGGGPDDCDNRTQNPAGNSSPTGQNRNVAVPCIYPVEPEQIQ